MAASTYVNRLKEEAGAHIAEAITEIFCFDTDYQADPDPEVISVQAADLLKRVPSLAEAVAKWNDMGITWDELVAQVRAALGK